MDIRVVLIFDVWNNELLTPLFFAPVQNNNVCKIFRKLNII